MKTYFLMYKDNQVLRIDDTKVAQLNPDLLPLPLRDKPLYYKDVIDNWAYKRIFSPNRENIKNVCEAYKLTLLDFEKVVKACHLTSINDSFWIKEGTERVTWKDVNLFTNQFDEWIAYRALMNISSVTPPKKVSPELTTRGDTAKAWFKLKDGTYLFKVGKYELAANAILDELGFNHVEYEEVKPVELMRYIPSALVAGFINKLDDKVVKCKCFTGPDLVYYTWEDYLKYIGNEAHAYDSVSSGPNSQSYYEMLVADYICNNSERYADDWGVLIGPTVRWLELAPLTNFDKAFSTVANVPSKTTYRNLRMEDAAKYAIKHLNCHLENVLEMKKPEELTDAQWKQVKERVNILIDFKYNASSATEYEELQKRVKPTSLFR